MGLIRRNSVPAQPARSQPPCPLAWPLGAPEASVRLGRAWLWRRCCTRVRGGGEPRLPVPLPGSASVSAGSSSAPRSRAQKTSPRSPGMGLATFSGLDMGSGDDRKVQPSPGGQLGSRQSRKGQISQAQLPTHPHPIFHTAAAAAAACCAETELAWVCLSQSPFGPGLVRGHWAKLPPPRTAMKACPSRASYELKI